MKSSYWIAYKTVEINALGIQINNNINIYNKINTIITENSLEKELSVIQKQIDWLIKVVQDKYDQISPSHKRKRAIISPLGSIIKIISGNLDEDDAIKFNEEIANLRVKENLAERKISSMQKAFNALTNISEVINNNVENLHFKFKQIDQLESKTDHLIHTMNSLYQILNNFRYIYENIQEIETAIAFSKLRTLHQSIINSTELLNVFKTIEQNAQTIYPVTKNNLLKLERNIILKSYIDKDKLVFILEIPLIEKETYNYYKIIPIPIKKLTNTYTIIPKYPYLLVNGLKYRNVVSPCTQIEPNKHLCSEENMAPVDEETCIEEIMLIKNNFSNCHQHQIKIEKLKIQKITFDHWMLYAEDDVILTEQCKDDTHRYNIQGTYILTSSIGCSIQIGKITIGLSSNMSEASLQTPLVKIPEVHYDVTKEVKKLDLTNVDFSDVKEIMNSVRNSNSEMVVETLVTNKISIWTLSLYVVALLIIIVIVFKWKFRRLSQRQNSPKSTSSPSDNFSLGEGEVKCDDPSNICFTSNHRN